MTNEKNHRTTRFSPKSSRSNLENDSASIEREQIDDLLSLNGLMSHHASSNQFLASESRLIHSKFQRLFHFLLLDLQHEPMSQAVGDSICSPEQVDDVLIDLNRNATLKFRNYKLFRENLLTASTDRHCRRNSLGTTTRQSMNFQKSQSHSFRSRNSLRYWAHRLIETTFFKWFIGFVICLDAVCNEFVIDFHRAFSPLVKITVAITVEYNSVEDSMMMVHRIAVFINRCILVIYVLEIICKLTDDFVNFWYSPVNILEFLLTFISLINLINEIYSDTNLIAEIKRLPNINSDSTETFKRIRAYSSILSLLRTLRMLRVLRILELAFRFPQVRIVFLALSRSVKLIFHVVLLTVILIYFFALIALYLTQYGLNTNSKDDMKKIHSLFGTVPRAFITVFRLFTKDEWFEIKSEMYALKINAIFIDIYVISWLFFGGYVLNPLLVGAMVGTFDETRKELTDGIQQIISKTRLSFNRTNFDTRRSSKSTDTFSSLIELMNSIELKKNSIEHDQDKLNEWLRSTLDEIKLIGQDPMENQWPLYTTFYYLQLLEIFFENIAERQLLFDFFSIFLLELHDKETNVIDPPILSSSSSDGEDDRCLFVNQLN